MLSEPIILLLLFIILIGLAVGSFLNVVILRGIKSEKLFGNSNWRSRCPTCKHTLSTWDLIPFFSFLFLRGKCRYCHKPISWQYPLVELGTSLLFVATAFFVYSLNLPMNSLLFLLPLSWGIFSVLIVVFVTDLRWGLVPVNYVWWSLPFALLFRINVNRNFSLSSNESVILTAFDVISSLVVGFMFYGLYIASKKRGIGEGDIPLGFLLGMLVGFPGVLAALLLSFVSGALVSLGLIALGRKKMTGSLPFGPFLITSMIVSVFWGDKLLGWYLGLLS